MKFVRHGDLLLVQIKEKVEGKEDKRGILALGEVTGHAHRICWDDLKAGRGRVIELDQPKSLIESVPWPVNKVVEADKAIVLEHEEHGDNTGSGPRRKTLPPGRYAVIYQREETAENESRTVID